MKLTLKSLLGATAASAVMAGAAFAETTITMWTFLDPAKTGGRDVALATMIDSFEAAHPEIKVQVEPQVWTTLAEKFVLGHGSGDAPDIGWVNAENLGLVLNSGSAADLGSLVTNKWDDARRADMVNPTVLDSVTVDGEIKALPIMAITWVTMYRKDLFEAAGLTKDDIATWDGVTDAAKKLTKDNDGDGNIDVYGLGFGLAQERFSGTPALFASFQANGGLFAYGCEPLLNNQATADAIAMQAAWISESKVAPQEAIAMTSDDAIEQFTAGRFAMQIIANSRFEKIQSEAVGWDGANLGIAPIPSNVAGESGPHLMTGWFAAIADSSDHQDEAALFIDWMTNAENAALWNIPGGQVPMMRSVAARPEMSESKYSNLQETAALMADSGVFLPGSCNWARTLADFNLATQEVILGNATPMEAVETMQSSTEDRQ